MKSGERKVKNGGWRVKGNGFTLIELVMVLVIVGIMAAVIMPKASASSAIRLEAVCQKIAGDLRYVQEMALGQQVRFGILFNPNAESYFAYRVDTSTKIKDPQTRNDLDISFTSLSEFKGIEIASTNFNDKIEFDSKGSPYNGSYSLMTSQGIIILQTADGAYSRTVRIEPKTGKVSVQ